MFQDKIGKREAANSFILLSRCNGRMFGRKSDDANRIFFVQTVSQLQLSFEVGQNAADRAFGHGQFFSDAVHQFALQTHLEDSAMLNRQ